jgi:hypothetical protein
LAEVRRSAGLGCKLPQEIARLLFDGLCSAACTGKQRFTSSSRFQIIMLAMNF